MHFRVELDMLYILAGRNFMSIDFIGGENEDKDCTLKPKKMKNLKISNFLNFSGPKPSNSLFQFFFIIYLYFQ